MERDKRNRRVRGAMAYHAGLSSEAGVLAEYERRGCVLLQQRWRCEFGEIDLILHDGAQVIFVEVKKSRDFGRASENLSPRQITRLYAAAEYFMGTMVDGTLNDLRFDVALVDAGGQFQILENAFA